MVKQAISLLAAACCIGHAHADVLFRCPSNALVLQRALPAYLKALKIPAHLVVQKMDKASGTLTLALNTAREDTRTLDFFSRRDLSLSTEPVRQPIAGGRLRTVITVSRKEIVLALLQHGRQTEFKARACSLEALSDHVGLRQNIVAWAEDLNWIWPDGGTAKWHSKYWKRGTPKPGVPVHVAFRDLFLNQHKYSIGCYAATKIVFAQGFLDYYRRVKPDRGRARRVEAALMADGEPLVDIEPGKAWRFEKDFDMREMTRPGKLTRLQEKVAEGNFVPGDWAYLLNTDSASAAKTGYEGSNAIYMGRNRFDDYYNDHGHFYTWEQKLDEVYQWRNGVFSRERDAEKIEALDADALAKLAATPEDGGIVLDIRIVPKVF